MATEYRKPLFVLVAIAALVLFAMWTTTAQAADEVDPAACEYWSPESQQGEFYDPGYEVAPVEGHPGFVFGPPGCIPLEEYLDWAAEQAATPSTAPVSPEPREDTSSHSGGSPAPVVLPDTAVAAP